MNITQFGVLIWKELRAEFHEDPRNTLFAETRSWTYACTERCSLHERHYLINL